MSMQELYTRNNIRDYLSHDHEFHLKNGAVIDYTAPVATLQELDMRQRIKEAIEKARENPKVQDAEAHVKEAIEKAKQDPRY